VSDRTKTRTIYSVVTTTPKSAVPTVEGDAARTSQRVGLAMADPTTRRALLGVPSDVFATWHDPHAEVRGRALAADPALPRGQPLRQSSRRSSRLTPPPSPPRRTSRTRAWPRPTASSRSSRSRSSRASTRAFPSTGASPSLARRTFQIHLDRFSFLRLLQRRLVVRACFFTRLKKTETELTDATEPNRRLALSSSRGRYT
jgi:hypothetical protein